MDMEVVNLTMEMVYKQGEWKKMNHLADAKILEEKFC